MRSYRNRTLTKCGGWGVVVNDLMLHFVGKYQMGDIALDGRRLHGECCQFGMVRSRVHSLAKPGNTRERAFENSVPFNFVRHLHNLCYTCAAGRNARH